MVSLYARLRVPKYQKIFEAAFFVTFAAIYFLVLLERNQEKVTALEVLLYVWMVSFAYEELGELRDAGQLLYAADLWNLTDICILTVAVAFIIERIIGLAKGDPATTNIAFDILSLEALFLIPRLCALISVNSYFGTLIPCLKEMSKDFVKFLGVVSILYLGFLATFSMLARDMFTLKQISWYLVYVFFGSSYLGFDIASEISPALGPPLMIVFVIMTNILLVTSLISLLMNTLTKVLDHAREEYLFQYSVFVREASALRRLTYFFPPLSLIPLLLFRPIRLLCVSSESLRSARIRVLKITHLPYIAAIWGYESVRRALARHDERSWHNSRTKVPSSVQTHFASQVQASRNQAKGRRKGEPPSRPTSMGATVAGASKGVDDDGLLKVIASLAAQVEELTRRLDEKEN